MSSSTTSTFPSSPLYTLRETPLSGRGIFATAPISQGTPILTSSLLPASMISRVYKREVCAHCFAYDGSRSFKLRVSETGHSFCGRECLRSWKRDAGELGIEAWTAVEGFIAANARGNGRREKDWLDVLPDEGALRPTPAEIEAAWVKVERVAGIIREVRSGSRQKSHRKALLAAQGLQAFPDTLSFLLSGILTLHRSSSDRKNPDWTSILDLVTDATPYPSPQDLAKNTRSYLHLLSILPLPLLDHATPANLRTLVTRDSHNSFGIRSLDDNGSEMFGYGVWPAASYFNHSCSPNVAKKRVGRAWEFWAGRDVAEGEELLISYMGGDEQALGVLERRTRSEEIWGFVCGCTRCCSEDEEMEGTSVGSGGSSLAVDLV